MDALDDKGEEVVYNTLSPWTGDPEVELAMRPPRTVVEWGLYPSFWNVVPVRAKMLLEAPRAVRHLPGCVLLPGNKPVRRVELCGMITEVVIRAAYAESKVEDATGTVNLRWSVDEEELLYGHGGGEEIQILRATLKEGARAIVTGKLNEYRGEPEVLVDYARLIKAPFEEAIFAEYVARVHDPAHPIDPGFTVPEDPAAFACVIVGEGPPGGVPAGGGHAAAPRAPAPAPLARTPHPAGWMGYPGALATAQAPPHAVPAAPLHSAARPRPHATAGPPHAAAAGPSGGPRAPLQGPPPEAARHRPGVALSAYDILFSRGGGAGPRPYAAPTPTPYPTHPGPAASQVSLAVGAPASAGPPVDPAEERRRRMQKIREDYERSLRGET